ncbi:tRNA (adenosine(37)-N6)-threonylcarbamoyltransferase complex ATPase subunit type 1 TsaE [Nocardioides campestrisoli]|uniref:tRNA (adenosine(37)-N6)-threonylcarbamoyltransferase complex ATPase subunit type 1 TsaE n=1 Tax=Nocardioides campestrisoli TaxID=2736757 RepID=UPI001CD40149|nr:tRNA (adenosine(37)-N6)-threonylcarbamoyltransferase complex ATPase subunit type 1 TsaE [Nocardioides campestrisoli]
MSGAPDGLAVRRVGAQAAAEVHAVVSAAFSARPALDPPADALAETPESVAAKLGRGSGVLATLDGRPVGALVLDPRDDVLYLRRVGVVPGEQGHGVAAALLAHACEAGAAQQQVAVLARPELPATVAFWESQGFTQRPVDPPYVELRRDLPVMHTVVDGERMQELGRRVGSLLEAGDLVVLSGELGAGKTTFTQGLGEGLGVRGGVTSPTFVIARVHPSLVDGPDLVHVDAYRLGGIAELDDLDLDTSLEDAVTVVEWGEGLAEVLAERRLEVHISRALADEAELRDDDLDPREVRLRWVLG